MSEISPIQSGSYGTPNYPVPTYTTATTVFSSADGAPLVLNATIGTGLSNVSVSDSNASTGTDTRHATKSDRASSTDGAPTYTFSDFLDTINPLEHIPIVSSVYRAITDEHINPIARIAGDVMYGGIFGLASAGLAAVGAVADTIIEAETGKSTAATFASMLGFVPDEDKTEIASTTPATLATTDPSPISPVVGTGVAQIPENDPNTVTTAGQTFRAPAALQMVPAVPTVRKQAAPQVPATNPIPLMQPQSSSTNSNVSSLATPLPVQVASASSDTGIPLSTAKAFPLDRSKMSTNVIADQSAVAQRQNEAMALAEGSHSMRLGNMIYTNRLMNGPHPLPVGTVPPVATSQIATVTNSTLSVNAAVANQAASNSMASTIASSLSPGNVPHQLPQALLDDISALKALNQYNRTASTPAATGSSVDLTN